jgi:hypothetical protein
MVGFASISFAEAAGYPDSYRVDAVERDNRGSVQRIVLRYIDRDMTAAAIEPWIVMRRLP